MKSATIHRLPTAATALPHAGARPFFEPAEENPDNPPQGLLASILVMRITPRGRLAAAPAE